MNYMRNILFILISSAALLVAVLGCLVSAMGLGSTSRIAGERRSFSSSSPLCPRGYVFIGEIRLLITCLYD